MTPTQWIYTGVAVAVGVLALRSLLPESAPALHTGAASPRSAAEAGPAAEGRRVGGGALASSAVAASGPSPAPPTAPKAASSIAAAWSPRAQATWVDLRRLADMPAGDAAIALGQQLEAAADAETLPAYRQALLGTTDAGVERTAMTALASAADGADMVSLADQYGSLPPERRGRILQVLEGAGNPAALEGLAQIVATDTSEKRSPLVMSALVGAANLGTMESVEYLIGQVGTANQDLALVALERVRTPQGVEIIRAAAQGSKNATNLLPGLRDAMARIAQP